MIRNFFAKQQNKKMAKWPTKRSSDVAKLVATNNIERKKHGLCYFC